MKMMKLVKKNKLIVLVAMVYVIVLIVSPEKAKESMGNSVYYLVEMLQVLPIIFMLTVVIDAWVPREIIMRGLGEKSGIKGNMLSLILGSISAGPIYAAFPIGKALLSKGASITNLVIIISSWAVIKIPMLANEAKFLGLEFMAVRWILTVISILIMGYLIGGFIKKKEIYNELTEKQADALAVNKEYCTGCGLCSRMMPEYFEMKEGKAAAAVEHVNSKDISSILETVEKCPTKAIDYEPSI